MKKRLLLITAGFPYGESERGFLDEEVRHLAEAFDLSVLAMDTGEELIHPTAGIRRLERYSIPSARRSLSAGMLCNLLHPSVLWEVWDCCRKNGFGKIRHVVQDILYFQFKTWAAKEKIKELIVSEKIDLVYTYWCTAPTLAAVMLKKEFPTLKVITRFHGYDLYEERSPINWQPFRRQIAEGTDGLCFACSYGQSYFVAHWGSEHKEKMRLCYLGSPDYGMMDLAETEKLHLLSCSSLIPLKRVERIVEGLSLLPEHVKIHWDAIGDGPELEKLEGLAEEKLGRCASITWKFHGAIRNAELAAYYRTLGPQLFITTSSTEGGAPVSIQEVFSMGIPAIGTQVGGIPDLVRDGETGFLLSQEAAPSEVAAAILRFVSVRNEERKQMRKTVREHWEQNFNACNNAARMTAYLLDLVSK